MTNMYMYMYVHHTNMSTVKRENGYHERDKESGQTSQVMILWPGEVDHDYYSAFPIDHNVRCSVHPTYMYPGHTTESAKQYIAYGAR